MVARSSCLGTLPLGLRGIDVDDLEPLGDLLGHQPDALAVLEDARRASAGRPGRRARRTRPPSRRGRRRGCRARRRRRSSGWRVEHVLDLLGRDVLALADDDVLDPAGDEDRAVRVEAAEVAGVQEPVGGERVGVERAVDVAAHHLRALHDDLALLAAADLVAVAVDELDRHAVVGPALGERASTSSWSSMSVWRDDRRLGHAVARRRADARRHRPPSTRRAAAAAWPTRRSGSRGPSGTRRDRPSPRRSARRGSRPRRWRASRRACGSARSTPGGVHASISTAAEPVSSGVNTPMMMPPTCVNGNATSAMSSSTTWVFAA